MNKILIAAIVLIVIFGTFILIGNKKTNPTMETTQPTSTQSTTKPVMEKTNSSAVNIILSNAKFVPKDIAVKAGSKVVWINKSGVTASINSDNSFLNLGEFANGTTLQAVFGKAGKYNYHNGLKPSQTGTVTVE